MTLTLLPPYISQTKSTSEAKIHDMNSIFSIVSYLEIPRDERESSTIMKKLQIASQHNTSIQISLPFVPFRSSFICLTMSTDGKIKVYHICNFISSEQY